MANFVTEISQPFDHAFLPYPSLRPRLGSCYQAAGASRLVQKFIGQKIN